ncbi:hypothetical protein C0993_008752 [Termitomyces sp. T159_Od127]|nr:hypothetical protein C0993_008753 [Termitomyces sp. T159_Od127]KAG6882892.1 hypothetical protein C0993_008752 [Termitomyces sp. T159_Od127]
MGARQMVTVLRQDYKIKVADYYIEAGRKIGGIPLITQSDRGRENNGMANCHTMLRHQLDPSLVGTLQHRWTVEKGNVKPEAAWSQLCHQFTPGSSGKVGFYPWRFCRLVFCWLAIPWLQAELDAWILPVGIPDIISAKPHLFGAKDEALYDNLGKPAVSSDTFWDIYADLLAAFQLLPHNPQLQAAFSNADLNLEDDVPLIAGLKDLCHGDAVGDLGYHYYGGLAEPPVAEIHMIQMDTRTAM